MWILRPEQQESQASCDRCGLLHFTLMNSDVGLRWFYLFNWNRLFGPWTWGVSQEPLSVNVCPWILQLSSVNRDVMCKCSTQPYKKAILLHSTLLAPPAHQAAMPKTPPKDTRIIGLGGPGNSPVPVTHLHEWPRSLFLNILLLLFSSFQPFSTQGLAEQDIISMCLVTTMDFSSVNLSSLPLMRWKLYHSLAWSLMVQIVIVQVKLMLYLILTSFIWCSPLLAKVILCETAWYSTVLHFYSCQLGNLCYILWTFIW